MVNRLFEKLFIGLLGVALLGWIGYHAFSFFHEPIQVETVFEYKVSHAISATGIAVREERVIEQRVTGIENYIYEDGTRVRVGQPIAEFYTNSVSDQVVKRMRELEEEIAMLTDAQDKLVNNFANTDIINRDIRDNLGRMTQMTAVGRFEQATDVRTNLVSLMNKRQVATGKERDYTGRIQLLQAEYDQLGESAVSENVAVANAPVSGYFVKSLDGYETILNREAVADYSIEEYHSLIAGEAPRAVGGLAGKIVTDQNWMFAAETDAYNTEWMYVGQKVELEIAQTGTRTPAAIEDILQHKDGDLAVILFRCNQVSEELINLRVADVVIHVVNYSGLRINSSAFRFQDNVRGVYIIADNVVRFRPIDPIYEEAAFALTSTNYVNGDPNQIRLFDQVIVKGKDIYDGKVVQ